MQPHRGAIVLTTGIVGTVLGVLGIPILACCPPVGFGESLLGLACSLVALILGVRDLRGMREGLMDPEGKGLTQGGFICGIIGTVINAIVTIISLITLILMLILIAAAPSTPYKSSTGFRPSPTFQQPFK
jgi:hypothetical protein